MKIVVKKTADLSEDEIQQILILFNKVFKKNRSEQEFINQSINNPLGYSYHSMMVENGIVVGMNSFVPSYYFVHNKKMLFANSIDSMVDKPYRDFFNFHDMVTEGFKKMTCDGVAFVYGYPNENAYPVLIKSRLYRDIGKMHIYCLPIHVGGVKKVLAFLNLVSELFCRVYVYISRLLASASPERYTIAKDTDSYNDSRYMRGDGIYSIASVDKYKVYYRIRNHDGIRTAFLIDLSEKSPKAFCSAIAYIIRNHRKEFDLLLYVGNLSFVCTGMIKLPRKFEPKTFNLTGRILNEQVFDTSIWDISNWDTNLSNYDLI